jgi:hypothetical protein
MCSDASETQFAPDGEADEGSPFRDAPFLIIEALNSSPDRDGFAVLGGVEFRDGSLLTAGLWFMALNTPFELVSTPEP